MSDEREELEKKLDDLRNKYEKLLDELAELQNEIEITMDKLNTLDDTMVRIVCPECLGVSFVKGKDGKKKHVCELCKGKGWVWAKRWVGI